jgi:hypothetical protein
MHLLDKRVVDQQFFKSFLELDNVRTKKPSATITSNKKHQSRADKIMTLNNLLKDGEISKTEFEKKKMIILQEKD